jgi:hypothetical protein
MDGEDWEEIRGKISQLSKNSFKTAACVLYGRIDGLELNLNTVNGDEYCSEPNQAGNEYFEKHRERYLNQEGRLDTTDHQQES